ncbi:uncharacterized protein N7500_007435 [Penicillium coprophilum]|uniref:uncharacterized protein n=1 Tax=Penicillium coprophilum TaxID=36646 RepID=UPI00238FD735|nr:uncharacterized protein N7500_007435 [Penicillium coprophilum]KAJ5165605.1 hypothetical protein N7500_007435 [Penicillium coprophilum]
MQSAPLPIAAVFTSTVGVKLILTITEAIEKRGILLQPYRDVHPEATSGIYSRAFFWWLNTLLAIGFRRIIRANDIFLIEDEMCAKVLRRRAQNNWAKANKSRSHALFWSTLNVTRRQLTLCIFPRLCLIAFRYTQPFLLSRTTNFVMSQTDAKSIGWGLTGAFGIVFIGTAIANGVYTHMTFRFTTVVRGTLVSMICAKTLDISIVSLGDSAALTLMSNDTETICSGFQNLHEIWAVPLELGIAMWLLYREVGLSFLAPALVAILSMMSIVKISSYIGGAQKRWNEGIQTRVDVTAAMLGSMKALKMLGFTPVVFEKVQNLRVIELQMSTLFRRLLSASVFFANNMRVLAPFVTLLVFAFIQDYEDLSFTPATAFTALSLIGMLSNPVNTMLRTIPTLQAALACFDRIQTFVESPSRKLLFSPLQEPQQRGDQSVGSRAENAMTTPPDYDSQEKSASAHIFPQEQQGPNSTIIEARNASFAWSTDGPTIIKDVTFSVARKDFIFIIGPVGCGKSTLLKGLLSETPIFQGTVQRDSLVSAFVDQDTWIQNITIRKNIIGPSLLDVARYEEVVSACALDHDIALMPDSHGRDTIVGSGGISLSGGQKQRVALARMLYANTKLMIIDDGFSGLDPETEDIVFTNLFGKAGLLRQLETTVLLVTNAVHRLPFADHIIALDPTGHITEQGTLAQLRAAGGYVEGLETKHKYEKDHDETAATDEPLPVEHSGSGAEQKKSAEEEELNRPIGEWSTYKYYFASIGWPRALLSLFYVSFSGVAVKLTELVVSLWTRAIEAEGEEVSSLYLGLYGMLTGIGAIFWNISVYHFFLYVVPASAEKLHAGLLTSVMDAPLSFFTNTDTGITTNRFSQDMSVVDKELPFALIDLVVSVVQALMGAVLMCLATGYFAPPATRDCRHVEAFGWSEEFVNQNLRALDDSQRPYYMMFCIQRWLSIVLDVMVAVLAVLLMVLIVELRESVGAEYASLALLNIMSFSASLAWIVRQWTSLETSIGAVSRVKYFTSTTPTENLEGECQTVPGNWPDKGGIVFQKGVGFLLCWWNSYS